MCCAHPILMEWLNRKKTPQALCKSPARCEFGVTASDGVGILCQPGIFHRSNQQSVLENKCRWNLGIRLWMGLRVSSLNGSFVFHHFFRLSRFTQCSPLSAVTVLEVCLKSRETAEGISGLLLTAPLPRLLFPALFKGSGDPGHSRGCNPSRIPTDPELHSAGT